VVGAGISGLSAAHFYRMAKPDARILILDNHDIMTILAATPNATNSCWADVCIC
jgi:flavin-dependent dehydrogenase